jgi:hypothetical protein
VLNRVQEGSKPKICDTVAESDFGVMHISDKAMANLLALSDVRNRAIMMYFNIDDYRFELQIHCEGPIYFFNRYNGLFVYDLEKAQSFAMVTTVEERKKVQEKRN